MENKSIIEVEESVQGALEALPSILRQSPSTAATRQISEALKILAPAGYHPVVELQENGRRKRRTASADNWTPETGEILITFSKESSVEQPMQSAANPVQAPFLGPRTRQLLSIREQYTNRVPPREESRNVGSRPTYPIASPSSGRPSVPIRSQASAASTGSPITPPDAREQELCRALDEVERQGRAFIALKWFRDDVLPSKGYPWAADAEERQAVLAGAIEKGLIVTSRVPNPRSPFPTTALRLSRSKLVGSNERQRYSPIRIQGEPLSSTILRDRGTD